VKKQDALFIAMAAGAIAFAFAFVAPMVAELAVPWYYPLERRWAFEVKPKGLAMDFFGRTIIATAAWCVVVIVTLAITKRVKAVSSRMIGLFAAWAIASIVLVMMNFAWTLYFRVPTPEPIPSWYVPR
jgi:hypothetical protein